MKKFGSQKFWKKLDETVTLRKEGREEVERKRLKRNAYNLEVLHNKKVKKRPWTSSITGMRRRDDGFLTDK